MRLFEFEVGWATASFDAIFPEHSALPHGIERMRPGQFLSDVIAEAPLEQAVGLRLTLWIFALAPIWFLRRLATISDLTMAERQRVVGQLMTTRAYTIRQLSMGLKAIGAMLYAQSAEVRSTMTALPNRRAPGTELVVLRRPSPSTSHPRGVVHEHAAE